MSVLATRDIVFRNLLSELNLNPEWERWRGYFFTGSIVCSLFPFYMTLKGVDLHCVPVGHHENIYLNCTNITSEMLSPSQTAYVNSQCAADGTVRWQRYAGAIMLGIAIFILLFGSSVWLHIKGVRDGINTFNVAGEKLLQIVLSEDEMIALCSKPLADENPNMVDFEYTLQRDGYELESHKAVQEFMRFCANDAPRSSMLACYLLRNIFLILSMIAASAWVIWVMTLSSPWSNEFECRMTQGSNIPFKELTCIMKSAITIQIFLGTFCGTLFLQMTMITCAIYKCYDCCDNSVMTVLMCVATTFRNWGSRGIGPENLPGRETIIPAITLRLLAEFWESANSVQSALLKEIVNYLYPKEFKRVNTDEITETISQDAAIQTCIFNQDGQEQRSISIYDESQDSDTSTSRSVDSIFS